MVSWVRSKCIGRGSFGTVSIGVDKTNGAVFAVKSVDRNNCLPNQIESLENEIRILRSLSSPYIVKFIGDDVTCESSPETTSYRNLHMEYMPGGTVADLATRGCDDVDERLARYYTWCVVSALRCLHSKRIVHCDVKGKNVLVGPGPRVCKLADFGSARKFSGNTCQSPIGPRGSPLWMAPEVIRRESQGPESDVWSLGCTVIEMVTGKPAWEDWGFDSLSRIGFSAELPNFPSQLSELGCDFLDKCLRRDPSQRWSCDQLLQHPFLLSVSPSPVDSVTEPSPRCVLDWVNSEFQNEGDEETGSSYKFEEREHEISAKDRISKLASSRGAIWETGNWELVREWAYETQSRGGDEGRGTRTEYVELTRTEVEIAGTSSEYSASVGEVQNSLNSSRRVLAGCAAGQGPRYGPRKEMGFYSLCNSLLVLFLYCFGILRNKLLLFYILVVFFSYLLAMPRYSYLGRHKKSLLEKSDPIFYFSLNLLPAGL